MYAILIFDAVFYFVLYMYLDRVKLKFIESFSNISYEKVLPNEYGTQEHPLFFIKNLFKKKTIISNQSNIRVSINDIEKGDN